MAIQGIRNFIGVSPSLSTAGQPSEDQLRELAQAGFEVVINLGLLDPRYCLANEQGLVESLGMQYCHIPVEFTAPRLEDLESFFDAMIALHDKKVFVHCAANYRVSSFVGLYGQAKLGWSADQADAHMRRVWEPNDTWKAFIEASRAKLKRGGSTGTDPSSLRVLRPGEGDFGLLTAIGVRFMVSAEDSGGGFALVEHPMPPRALAAPLHRHNREDEYSFVLEGRLGALLGEHVVYGEVGDLIFKPRGQWHTFWNAGDTSARILEIISPAGFERYFQEMAALPKDATAADRASIAARYELQVDPGSIPRLLAEHGLQFGPYAGS